MGDDGPDAASPRLSRRIFVAGGLAALGAAACSDGGEGGDGARPTAGGGPGSQPGGTAPATLAPTSLPVPALPGDPFTLGVASGDPTPEAVILWTRLVPDPTTADGAMPAEDVAVRWVVSTDEGGEEVVAEGVATAEATHAHAVHVDATGLEPATAYWYRFTVGEWTSPVGRTRTLPAADAAVDQVRLAVANCQAWQSGWYTAYRHLAAEEAVDAVLFLGDFVYELESSVEVRPHGLDPPVTLDEYRVLYALNRTDPDLQRAQATLPWIVTWDDHEVEDNYAGLEPGTLGAQAAESIEGGFAAKRAAAYEAWWEHQPVRAGPPVDGVLPIHRAFAFGDLVTMAVLDTRQYRSPEPADAGAGSLPRGFGGGPQPDGAFDPDATMLGDEQEAWVLDTLGGSPAVWDVLAQQSIMAEVNRLPDQPGGGFSVDSWDGYVVPRRRLFDGLVEAGVDNLVSIGGDLHTSVVADLRRHPEDPATEVVGAELIGPSVSALELLAPEAVAGARSNAHIKLYDIDRRGYLVVTFTPEQAEARFRYVDATAPDAAVTDGSRWIVRAGTPGARPA